MVQAGALRPRLANSVPSNMALARKTNLAEEGEDEVHVALLIREQLPIKRLHGLRFRPLLAFVSNLKL